MMMPKDIYAHGKWLTICFFTFIGIGFLWIGCGKKNPPKPPELRSPPAVKDLRYAMEGPNVELSWTVPGAGDGAESAPVRCKIFRSKLSAEESNCEKCPVDFVVAGDIPIQTQRSGKPKPAKMRFSEVLEPDYRYIYKVIVYDKDGQGSKDSNTVQFDYYPN